MRPVQRAGTLLGVHLLAALYAALLIPPPSAALPRSAPTVSAGPGPTAAGPWRAAWHQPLLRAEHRPDGPPVRRAVGGEPAWTHTCLRGDEPSCPRVAPETAGTHRGVPAPGQDRDVVASVGAR